MLVYVNVKLEKRCKIPMRQFVGQLLRSRGMEMRASFGLACIKEPTALPQESGRRT